MARLASLSGMLEGTMQPLIFGFLLAAITYAQS